MKRFPCFVPRTSKINDLNADAGLYAGRLTPFHTFWHFTSHIILLLRGADYLRQPGASRCRCRQAQVPSLRQGIRDRAAPKRLRMC
jgi:hypothetical protein